MIPLAGRTALITGANRGLGALTARALGDLGCQLILHGRHRDSSNALADALQRDGVSATTIAADLADPDAVLALCAALSADSPPIDILVNNAGVQIAYRPNIVDTPATDYRDSFQINCTAPMMLCYAVLPGMQARGFGRIVNVTSGIDNEPQQAGYSASKAALDKVTVDLARHYGSDTLLINLVDPGWCRTDLGGPNAPNAAGDALPGLILPVAMDDGRSGRLFRAQDYRGMALEQAVAKAAAGTD